MKYTREDVHAAVQADAERLFAPWCIGRPDTWKPDGRTKDTVTVGLWLREELTRMGLSEVDRKTQESVYHRFGRSDGDLFELAADVLNDALEGRIQQGRVPHHRWG